MLLWDDQTDLHTFIGTWNNLFPLDRWWREKYKIPFNSEQHRNQNLFDILFEWEEDKIYRELYEDLTNDKNKVNESDKYIPGKGKLFTKMTSSRVINEDKLKNLSLDEIKYDEKGNIVL